MSEVQELRPAALPFMSALQRALTLEQVTAAFLSTVSCVIDAHAVGVYRLDEGTGAILDVCSDAANSFLDDFEDYGRADDPVLQAALQRRGPVDSTRAVRRQGWESSGARAALGRAGLEHSLEAPLLMSGKLLGTVNFARANGHQAFSESDLVRAGLVGEQLGCAMERAIAFEATNRRANLLERALDRVQQPIVITSLESDVLFCNRAAYADPATKSLADGGASSDDTFATLIDDAMAEFRGLGKRVCVASYQPDRQSSGRILKSYRLRGGTYGAAVTFVYHRPAQAESARLPAWSILTRREQEIAELVSEGLSTKQIAERAFISENTVKQHLKRVFTKTDVHSRAELVQLIWSAGEQPGADTAG